MLLYVPIAAMPIDCRPLASWCREARPVRNEPRKPSNWWALEREPRQRVSTEVTAKEKAEADKERADHAQRSAFAIAVLGMAMANAPPLVAKELNLGELADLYASLENPDLRAIVAAMAAVDARSSPAGYGGNDEEAYPPSGDDYNDLWFAILRVLKDARRPAPSP